MALVISVTLEISVLEISYGFLYYQYQSISNLENRDDIKKKAFYQFHQIYVDFFLFIGKEAIQILQIRLIQDR